MNSPTRRILQLLKSVRINVLDAFDSAQDVIDRSEKEREANRTTYARDLSNYIEGPTRRLNQRKEPT